MTGWLLVALAAAILAIWTARHFTLSAAQRGEEILSPAAALPLPPDPPRATILVPARNEEANIAACLESLCRQTYPNFEIIVVDDRSTDSTADLVRSAAAADPRIRLVQVAELPPGWFGKAHALWTGAQAATGDWILFVDADCRQDPHSLSAVLGYILAAGGDMLSLWPLIEMHSFGENLIQPLCGSILALYFRPAWVNDPKKKVAFANGQFILIRRRVYEAVGGHQSLRDTLVEDIALARLVKGHSYRLLNAVGLDLFRTRMYDSLPAAWRGWTRIFSQAFRHPGLLVAVLLGVFLFSGSPFVLLVWGGLAAHAAGWNDLLPNILFALGLAQVAMMMSVLVRFSRMSRAQARYLFFYPLSVVLVMGIIIQALASQLGLVKVTWRGTTYRGRERV
jgi:chlorobactene glucosyltransferase